jgi:replication-associated recombination protein RarA
LYELVEQMGVDAAIPKAAEPGAITILSGPPRPGKTTVGRILAETAEKPTRSVAVAAGGAHSRSTAHAISRSMKPLMQFWHR